MPEHPTDAHFSFTFVFKQALIYDSYKYIFAIVYAKIYTENNRKQEVLPMVKVY